ncbi:hypothetical protein SOP94_04565 [Peribacillus frigoritolerans]|uniref:hypothetical protein n=1 Tax=Peribacillus frigoritolerans TaxID=450367 RepID=UPI002B24EB32|nr:hypothetical protein [Peribacillus frigoritolerans]MEB2627724.1 hypothetical protein [Peribacillus frigoritolerans]
MKLEQILVSLANLLVKGALSIECSSTLMRYRCLLVSLAVLLVKLEQILVRLEQILVRLEQILVSLAKLLVKGALSIECSSNLIS